MRKLSSAELEKKALRAMLSSSSVGKSLIGSLNASHFVTEVGSAAFLRVQTYLKKHGDLPSWSALCDDPALSNIARGALKSYKSAPLKTKRGVDSVRDSLESYRKLRAINDLLKMGASALEHDGTPVETVVDRVAKAYESISQGDSTVEFHNIGTNANLHGVIKNILRGRAESFIPSGFLTFDAKYHGLPAGATVVAAESGQGKSVMAQTLARNAAKAGYNVAFVGLEMTVEQMMMRELAFQSGLPLNRLLSAKKSLSATDRRKASKAFDRLNQVIKKAGGKLSFLSNVSGLSIEALLATCRTRGFQMIVIDYIGLMEGTDGDDQAKALGRIARAAHSWGLANKSVVVLCAQLSEEGKLRYSKAVGEHAALAWIWQRTSLDKDNNLLTVRQPKGRMQGNDSFSLFADLGAMTIRDLTGEEVRRASAVAAQAEKRPAKKAGGKAGRFFRDLTTGAPPST